MPERGARGDDLAVFESHRRDLLALAYRMLGDLARAQDMVQEAWLRWQQRPDDEVASPRAYLVTIVTRLCLNQLEAASVRREEQRGDRLPEPVDLSLGGLERIEHLEQVSMAFLVLLERLPPAERAVLLLHDVFDFEHAQIGALVGKSAASCRKLLERARRHVAAGRRLASASPAEHARLLEAFVHATAAGDVEALTRLLADDAELITDGGPGGQRLGGLRNLSRPLIGAAHIAAFVTAAASRVSVELRPCVLNGQPACLVLHDDAPLAAVLLAVADGRIERVFFHADPERLRFLGEVPRRPG